uniref:Uncharacterized protein n=1 Tax=Octopus bimaculoides TaxID=37653 RepID=A0A0L8I8Q8_OCTBM
MYEKKFTSVVDGFDLRRLSRAATARMKAHTSCGKARMGSRGGRPTTCKQHRDEIALTLPPNNKCDRRLLATMQSHDTHTHTHLLCSLWIVKRRCVLRHRNVGNDWMRASV